MIRKLKLILEYCGSSFVGFQSQTSGSSIQETLEAALGNLTQESILVRAAGRTDAGVHAQGQVVSFVTQSNLPLHAFVHGTNAYLPKTIAVLHAEEVPNSFDARHSASGKWYRYQIWNAKPRSALRYQTHFHVRSPLALEQMQEAAHRLVGTHDFRAFRAADCERKTTVRTMKKVQISSCQVEQGTEFLIDVEGTAFLKNMVRIMAGTLVQVGLGKMTVDHINTLLRDGDRTLAGPTAPSHGLYLCRVDYHKRTGK